MGIKKVTTTVVTCDYPDHPEHERQLLAGETFHKLLGGNGKAVVICNQCWMDGMRVLTVLELIGAPHQLQTVGSATLEIAL